MSDPVQLTPVEARRLFDLAMAEDDEIKNTRRTPLETLRHQLDLGPQDEIPAGKPRNIVIG